MSAETSNSIETMADGYISAGMDSVPVSPPVADAARTTNTTFTAKVKKGAKTYLISKMAEAMVLTPILNPGPVHTPPAVPPQDSAQFAVMLRKPKTPLPEHPAIGGDGGDTPEKPVKQLLEVRYLKAGTDGQSR